MKAFYAKRGVDFQTHQYKMIQYQANLLEVVSVKYQ